MMYKGHLSNVGANEVYEDIRKIYNYIIIMNRENEVINLDGSISSSSPKLNATGNYFLNYFKNSDGNNDGLSLPVLDKEFNNFKELPATLTKVDVLKEWEKIIFAFPNLYNIALSILNIPATQVSVDRLFSVFKWVYN